MYEIPDTDASLFDAHLFPPVKHVQRNRESVPAEYVDAGSGQPMVLTGKSQVKQLLTSVRANRSNMQQKPAQKRNSMLVQYRRLCCDRHGSWCVVVCNPGIVSRVTSAREHVVLEKKTQEWGCTANTTNKTGYVILTQHEKTAVSPFWEGTVAAQIWAASLGVARVWTLSRAAPAFRTAVRTNLAVAMKFMWFLF